MKHTVLPIVLCLVSAIANGQTPALPTPEPFRLDVSVAYANADKAPALANYLYKKIREIPGVVIVPDKDAYVSLVVSDVGTEKVYSCVCVTMETAKYEINGALIYVQLAPTTGDQKADAWQGYLKDAFAHVKPVYRLKESWMVLTASPHAGLDQIVDHFNSTYVEKIRREWEAPLTYLEPPAGGWKAGPDLHSVDWMSKAYR